MRNDTAFINHLHRLKRDFPREFSGVDIEGVEIYIDIEDRKERRLVVEIIRANRHRFMLIMLLILEGRTDKYLYRKEPKGVKAMKLKNKDRNSRIYCVEFSNKGEKKKVVMVRGLLHKASDKNDAQVNAIIDAICDNKYNYFTNSREAVKHRNLEK